MGYHGAQQAGCEQEAQILGITDDEAMLCEGVVLLSQSREALSKGSCRAGAISYLSPCAMNKDLEC